MRYPSLMVAVALAVIALAGCGSSKSGTTAVPGPGTTASTTAAATPAARLAVHHTAPARKKTGTVVKVTSSRFGKVLVDGKGRTLYLFTHDGAGKPRCYGNCATSWPPLTTSGKPRAGQGAAAGLLGSTGRRGGVQQVTYKGHPLYRYVGDTRPGQILCQNVVEFGGTWLVVKPSGDPVR